MGYQFLVQEVGQIQEPLVASLLLVAMPFAPTSLKPGAPSSVLAPINISKC